MEEYVGKHTAQKRDLYAITEYFETDGGFGDAIPGSRTVGYVMATATEIEEYLKKWDKPRCYDVPYSNLWEHHIVADVITTSELKDLVPYRGDPDEPHCDEYLQKLKKTGAKAESPWEYMERMEKEEKE